VSDEGQIAETITIVRPTVAFFFVGRHHFSQSTVLAGPRN
jgi:hypothetical protein